MASYDVLVAGGGPAGAAAAITAGRLGAKTLLVERYGFLGGMATAGLVSPFMVSRSSSGETIMSPFFSEIVDRLRSRGAALSGELFSQPHIAFDPEALKNVLLEMSLEAGVKLSLHSLVTGAILRGNRFSGVVIDGKSGQFRAFSDVSVDSTGDADLAWMAKAPFVAGREGDGLMQPATLNFRVAGIDPEKMPERDELDSLFRKAVESGAVSVKRDKLLWFETTRPGELHFNVTRVTGVDGTSVSDLTRAEVVSRKQAEEVFAFLKAEVPGFESAYVSATGAQVGIRETRRIVGEYVLTGEDVTEGADFPDAIARCSYPVDIHDPKGKGTKFNPLTKPYSIPYRCLVPGKIEGLLVAGRSISADHVAQSSLRVMPTCFMLGEAAGAAAAQVAKARTVPRKADTARLVRQLREMGANYL